MRGSLTSFIRKLTHDLLNSIAVILDRLGVSPNVLTVLGVVGHLLAAGLIGMGYLIPGALVLLFFGLFDALDGALARFQDKVSKFGAFLDSVCDRFSEGFISIGLFYYLSSRVSILGSFLVLLSVLGAVLVSYVRARAEAVGVLPTIGIMTRLERYIVLIVALLLDKIEFGLAVITVLSVLTIGQRIWFVHRQLELKK